MDQTTLLYRLKDLKAEYEAGETQLKSLQQKERELQNTMLRIAGAIQVLEELLQETGEEGAA